MSEADIQNLLKKEFEKVGVKKFWHPTKVRISSDTVKTFRDLSDPEIKTMKGDLCFIDVGPIVGDHEADYGKTFVVGAQTQDHPLIQATESVFNETKNHWMQTGATGTVLFEFARKRAESMGYELNPLMAGHRIGDFPHKLYAETESLFQWGNYPQENLWILEIHLIDRKINRGSFFEDLL